MLRKNVLNQRAALNGRIGRNGPNVNLEANDRVNVKGKTGGGAVSPASRRVRREGDPPGLLLVVAGGISCMIRVRDDPNGGIRAVGRSKSVRVVGQGIVPCGSLESRLSKPERIMT